MLTRIKRKIEEKWIHWRMKWAISLLRNIDFSMKRLGWTRQRRRQFWREFSKSPRLQDEIFDGLLNAK